MLGYPLYGNKDHKSCQGTWSVEARDKESRYPGSRLPMTVPLLFFFTVPPNLVPSFYNIAGCLVLIISGSHLPLAAHTLFYDCSVTTTVIVILTNPTLDTLLSKPK